MPETVRAKNDITKGRYPAPDEHPPQNPIAPLRCTCVAVSNENGGYTVSASCPRHDAIIDKSTRAE